MIQTGFLMRGTPKGPKGNPNDSREVNREPRFDPSLNTVMGVETMPFKYQLTWMPHAHRWRKRYRGKTYYLRSPCRGKKDRDGYLAALEEWNRLKLHLDGLGPSPYTADGVLIPVDAVVFSERTVTPFASQVEAPTISERLSVETYCERWLSARRKEAERGNLSLKQWSEDSAKLKVFRNFLTSASVEYVDQIDAQVLDNYRDEQWSDDGISRSTLKKRLDTVGKWLRWMVDESHVTQFPKDLSSYAKVKLDPPSPAFFSDDEVRQLINLASIRTRLYMVLALNLGFTQRDIATLEHSMIDWETGIITRERHKTKVPHKSRLWPSTLELLRGQAVDHGGLVLVTENGKSLYEEQVNAKGNLVYRDPIRLAFDRVRKRAKLADASKSFKHLRKTAANKVELMAPHLTSAFLGHAETATKRYYVARHFDELFEITDRMEAIFIVDNGW